MRIAIGERYKLLLCGVLAEECIDVLWLPDNPNLDTRLSGHADLNVYYEENTLWIADGIDHFIVNNLALKRHHVCTVEGIGAVYPRDVPLCACPVGNYLFCNPNTAESKLLRSTKRTIIPVRQGYTRCSICVISDDAIITADKAIASQAVKHSLSVLEITPGHIELDGFNEGFIGGATFRLSNTKIALTGHLHDHPDEASILAFLKKHGVSPVYLTNSPIFDIGGGISLP